MRKLTNQISNNLSKLLDSPLDRVAQIHRHSDVRVHQHHQTVDQIGDELERSRLLARSVNLPTELVESRFFK